MRAWFALAVALSTVACNDETVEDVPQDVCVSGKRWIGGRRGSEEMYPGRDCVGCHLENDGPQLMAGGTVYAFSEGKAGANTIRDLGTAQSVDCFGLEGVTVTLRSDADDEVFTTVTNRAGNFFFEGRPSELAKPFKATIEYDVPASADRPANRAIVSMTTAPSYGGCARCHSPYAVATDPLPAPPYAPDVVLGFASDYIDLRLPVADFITGSVGNAGPPDDAAHAASVAEIQDFVNETGGH
jgi:hypothetical protein